MNSSKAVIDGNGDGEHVIDGGKPGDGFPVIDGNGEVVS